MPLFSYSGLFWTKTADSKLIPGSELNPFTLVTGFFFSGAMTFSVKTGAKPQKKLKNIHRGPYRVRATALSWCDM